MTERKKVIIMGAAGRDFHNFNVYFRGKDYYEVVAFTATQIPDIAGRKYPRELAGDLYPNGIPIYPEEQLKEIITKYKADLVVFAYSDVPHEEVMHKASIVNAAGPDFSLMGTHSTMIISKKPIISICAVRTGCGKSQTSRRVSAILRKKGKKVVVIRHPMPYGNLAEQAVQRFATYADLDKHHTTIEEREEYEPHIDEGMIVYAGVDYQKILDSAEKEADIILWDGGNNDLPFYKPNLHIVIVDPHRPGHELQYHPGEANLRMADVVIINKVDTATPEHIEIVKQNVKKVNPRAIVVEAASPVSAVDHEKIRGKRVLVIEDGPTVTHGGMGYGAGTIAARKFDAAEMVDPKSCAVGSIKETFKKYPHLKNILPAMGYSDKQIRELEKTINAIDCDLVIEGTPIKLERLLKVNKPIIKVTYELDEIGHPNLEDILKNF